jgi:futalosine hydrolase
LLIPTELEAIVVREQLQAAGFALRWRVELCGCGPFLSGARTMQLLQQLRPERVVLLGIAGGFTTVGDRIQPDLLGAQVAAGDQIAVFSQSPSLDIGCAYEFTEVFCDGFGAGSGSGYRSAWQLQWHCWEAPSELQLHERLPLQAVPGTPHRVLLCSSTASADASDAADRLSRAADALAEDMETYSVALACRLAHVPLRVIRGISNRAGDRQHASWRVTEALRRAVALLCSSP